MQTTVSCAIILTDGVILDQTGRFFAGKLTPVLIKRPSAIDDPDGAAIISVNALSNADFADNGVVTLKKDGTIVVPRL